MGCIIQALGLPGTVLHGLLEKCEHCAKVSGRLAVSGEIASALCSILFMV